MSFFYYFLHFVSSLVHFLSFSVLFSPFLYFISSLPRASTSYIYLPISSHLFLIHRSCFVRPFLFHFFLSFSAPFFSFFQSIIFFIHFFINFLLFLGSFLPSFILSSLPLFHAFVFLYLFTLGCLYSHFPSFDTNIFLPFSVSLSHYNPSLPRKDRRHDYVMRSAGKCIASVSDMSKGPEPLSTSQVSPSLQKFLLLLD